MAEDEKPKKELPVIKAELTGKQGLIGFFRGHPDLSKLAKRIARGQA